MACPQRLLDDVEGLRAAGLDVALVEEEPRYFVVIRGLELPPAYTPQVTDLMVMADYQYPMSALDMYWTDPEVRCATSGGLPQAADQFQVFIGRNWQRWSWHYDWKPAQHNLATHLDIFFNRLAIAA